MSIAPSPMVNQLKFLRKKRWVLTVAGQTQALDVTLEFSGRWDAEIGQLLPLTRLDDELEILMELMQKASSTEGYSSFFDVLRAIDEQQHKVTAGILVAITITPVWEPRHFFSQRAGNYFESVCIPGVVVVPRGGEAPCWFELEFAKVSRSPRPRVTQFVRLEVTREEEWLKAIQRRFDGLNGARWTDLQSGIQRGWRI